MKTIWKMPRNAHYSHYCCHCVYWTHIKDVGCAHIGRCDVIAGDPTEQDAYDPPCGLWKGEKG